MARRAKLRLLLAGFGVVAVLALAWLFHGDARETIHGRAVLAPGGMPASAPAFEDVPRTPVALLPADAEARPVEADASAPAPRTAAAPDPRRAEDLPWRLLVMTAARVPVSGARVDIWDSEAQAVEPAASAPATLLCDGLGRCTLPELDEDQAVSVRDDVAGTSGLLRFFDLDGRATRQGEIAIILQPPARIRGRVLSHDGRPVADAVIHGEADFNTPVRGMPVLPEVLTPGRDGGFDITCDSGGGIVLWATAESILSVDGSPLPTATLPLSPVPGDNAPVELRFPGNWILEGNVLDEAGKPVPGAQLWLWKSVAADAPVALDPPGEDSFFADAVGHFEVSLMSAGEYRVRVSSGACAPVAVTIPEEDGRVSVTLLLPPPASISGFVRDETGRPLGGVDVSASPAEPEARETGRHWAFLSCHARTAADGSFRLENLVPGWRYFVACAVGATGTRVSDREALPPVPAGATDVVRIVPALSSNRQIRGRVVAAASGRPIVGASLWYVFPTDEGGFPSSMSLGVHSDSEGAFVVGGLRAGEAVAIGARAAGYAAGYCEALPIPPEGRDVVIELPAPGSLLVTVQTVDGRPSTFVPVLLRRADGARVTGPMLTDAEGRVLFEGLDTGPLEVTALSDDMAEGAWRQVEIRSAAIVSVVISQGVPPLSR